MKPLSHNFNVESIWRQRRINYDWNERKCCERSLRVVFVWSNWKSLCLSSTSCVMYSIGNGAFVAWRSVELTTNPSPLLLVEILRCSAFTVAVQVELMGLFSFLVMATPRKENKGCHVTTNLYQSPSPCIRGALSCKEVLWLPLLENVSQKSTLGRKLKTGLQFSSLSCTKLNRLQTTSGQPWDWSLAARYIKSSAGVQY